MKYKETHTQDRNDWFIESLCAFVGFLGLYPFYIWPTYRDGIFYRILGIDLSSFALLCCLLCQFIYLLRCNVKISKIKILCCLLFLILSAYMTLLHDGELTIKNRLAIFMSLCVIAEFVLLPDKVQAGAFRIFYFIFALFLIPSLIVWVCHKLGIVLPYGRLESPHRGKVAGGVYYALYPGAIVMRHDWLMDLFRICGVTDEPGALGTFAALLLSARGFRLKKDWQAWACLLTGTITASLAFYIIVAMDLFMRIIREHAVKAISLLLVAGLMLALFFSIPWANPTLQWIQSRFRITANGKLAGDSRTTAEFERGYTKFIEEGLGRVLIGNGYGAASRNPQLNGGNEYRMLIYDYGIIGFIAILAWIFFSVFALYGASKNWDVFILLVVFMASIYQRVNIFNMAYFVLLLGGSAYLRMLQAKSDVAPTATTLQSTGV